MWAGLVSFVHSYPGFRIFSDAFFEEIHFSLEADHFHPFKRIADFVVSMVAKGNQDSVGAELDVVTHHGRVHSNEFDGESINNSTTNSISMLTALLMILVTRAAGRWLISLE